MLRALLGACILALVAACEPREREVILACTTSVEDSGLLDALLPAFGAAHPGHDVKVIAVGSGEALALGARGDADVVLAHSPAAEQAFMAAGHGRARHAIMANDFVLVGPSSDPARVRGRPPVAALRAIAAARAPFVSRADYSGTHARERALWAEAGLAPAGGWYMEIGQGMGEALRVASERAGYTLSDRATFLALARTLLLEIVVEDDSSLGNVYTAITTTRGRNPRGADLLVAWLGSPAGQERIRSFGTDRFGRSLFEPRADTR